jgi:hypothetical protein
MTPQLLAATLRPHIEDEKVRRLGFAVQTRNQWTGPDTLDISGHPVRIEYCRSMLEMREKLTEWDRATPLAMVTPVEDRLLAADLRARVFKRRILTVDVWTVLEEQLKLRFIEPKVRADRLLGNVLLEVIASHSVPPPISGVLHEESVWDLIFPARFGLSSARADLVDLLSWTRTRNVFESSDPELRQRMIEFFIRKHSAPAKAIFDCYSAGADPLTVGLAYEPLLAEPANPELARAFGRMERFTNNQPVAPAVAAEWHKEAQSVMARLNASEAAEVIDGLDRTFLSIGIEPHAHLSRWSRIGSTQALDRFAESPSDNALEELRKRHWPASDRGILDRAAMLLRLRRWLAVPDASWSNLQSAGDWYRAEGSWVDLARSRLRFTSESSKWNGAVNRLLEQVRVRRENQNRRFAALLAAWTRDGSPPPVLGIEKVLATYAAPLAEHHPVLVIVMDGMSFPVARELEPELAARRWNFWSTVDQELPPAVSALPSVTQFSRASLLAGRLITGTQDAEARHFGARTDLRRPSLFHKNDLAPASDEVLREIADTDRRVVGVVVNAIDDELGGSRQVSPDWTLEYLAVLRGILAEAATAGRMVVITSDHGHTLETGSAITRGASATSDRWRTGTDVQPESELLITGPRVLSGSGEFIGLAVESARYLRPKVGYHGGLTPQECLVPVMLLAQPSVTLRGYHQISPTPPSWWSHEPTPPKPARQSELFAPAADWIHDLVRSEVFQLQVANTNGRVSPAHVEATVRALDATGGRLLKPTFAQRVGITLGRVSPYIAAVQRVLNVDGYGVLELDEASQTITLNRALLLKQFRLE